MGYHESDLQSLRPPWPEASPGLRTVAVRDLDGLARHRPAWDAMAWDAPQRLATLLPAWLDASFRYGPEPGETWLCIFAYDGDRLVGVLPLIAGAHPLLGRSRPVLRTCDRHVTLENITLAPDCAGAALGAMLARAAQEEPDHLGIDLMGIRRGSPVWTGLGQGVKGYLIRHGSRYLNSRMDVSGSFDAYLADAGSMRANLKRYRRKFEAMGPVSSQIIRDRAEAHAFLDEFLVLEASGWKGRGGSAILNNANARAFHERLVRNLAIEGRLQWYALRLGERLVAARMAILCGQAIMFPKIAFDEDFAAVRPGTLLTADALRDVFARPDIVEANFMSNATAHRFWHMPKDEYTNVHLIRASALPLMAQWPRLALRSIYRDHVRPNISPFVSALRQRFRRDDLRPRRAADARGATLAPRDEDAS